MSDEFFGVADNEGQSTDLLKQFKEEDVMVLRKIINTSPDIPVERIVKIFKKELDGLTDKIPAILRENIIVGKVKGILKSMKETVFMKFLLMTYSFKDFGGNYQAKAWGYIIDEVTIDGEVEIKRVPALIICKSKNFDEVSDFINGAKRLHTYELALSIQGERKLDYGATYLSPMIFFTNDLTKFDDVIDKPSPKLTLVGALSKAYGLEVKTVIETPSMKESSCGLSSKQKGNQFINDNDIKLLMVNPTDNARATNSRVGYMFKAHPINDPNESIDIFCFNDKTLIDFETGSHALILIGAVKKSNNSAYSDYQVELVGMEKWDWTAVEKFIS